MTNSLSEQVAGLERQITEVWDIAEAWKLNSERHWKRVEELEAERDRLKADAMSDLIKRQRLETQVRNREAERDDLQRQVQEARDESATLPRVIGADELREGQTVAVYSDRSGVAAGVVYDLEPDVFRLDPGFHHSRTRYRPWMLSAIRGETIVLLEDAPQPTSYADDDHQDAEITDWHKPHRVVFQRASEAQ